MRLRYSVGDRLLATFSGILLRRALDEPAASGKRGAAGLDQEDDEDSDGDVPGALRGENLLFYRDTKDPYLT